MIRGSNDNDFDQDMEAAERMVQNMRTWLAGTDRDAGLAFEAELFLQWRTGYSTGDLTLFDASDIDEYLLEWCPRKLSFAPEDWMPVLDSVIAYVDFLVETGQWRSTASSGRAVVAHADGRRPAFVDAMGSPSNFGLAKSMLMGPALAGALIDLEDPSSLQAAMDGFNALSFEERKALTDPAFDRMSAPQQSAARYLVPPIRMPSDAAVEASAAAAPLVGMVNDLREYLGEKGVALTGTGNLKLADCRVLVDRLNTGDTFDPVVFGASNKTRSLDELHTLSLVVFLAVEAGAVRRLKGRMVPVKRWTPDHAEQASVLARIAVVTTMPGRGDVFDRIEVAMHQGVPYLLTPSMAFRTACHLDEIMELAVGAAMESGPVPSWLRGPALADTVRRELRSLMRKLALAGIVTFNDDQYFVTPFGVHVTVADMKRGGFVVPELPPLDMLSATELLLSIDDCTTINPAETWTEWQPHASDEEKAEQLVAACAALPDGSNTAHRRQLTMALLEVLPPTIAATATERWRETPLSGYYLTFLATDGLELPASDIGSLDDTVLPLVDKTFIQIEVNGPEVLRELDVAELIEFGAYRELFELMARLPNREVGDVLHAFGAHLPDKRAAKAARTALHRWRSRWSR